MILGRDAYEAIVVGSGFGGAVAACRLAQAGVDVGVLERGRRFPLGGFPRHTVRADLLHWHHGGPYDIRPFNDVLIVQGAAYGGGSLIYANVQVRPPADVFAEGWPVGYSRASLDPSLRPRLIQRKACRCAPGSHARSPRHLRHARSE